MSSVEFCNRLLDEQKVVCIPGSAFGECGEGFIRIAYTCSDDNLYEALNRISCFCKKTDEIRAAPIVNGQCEFDHARPVFRFSKQGRVRARSGKCRLESRRNQILPLKPENHALERFSEWACVVAKHGSCFCI